MNNMTFKLKENMERRIVGKSKVIESVIVTLLAGGHLLLEDVPGVGKTTLAKTLADSISLSFARLQCTPDVTPGDITGISVYDQKTASFQVMPGPVINNIVLADELNRTSPKTQSALLEVMEEHRVTIDGKELTVPEPFMVIGTQNPVDMAGTYPLPESQLDRFMVKLSVGYPEAGAEEEMAFRFLEGDFQEKLQPVLSGEDILAMRKEVIAVKVHEDLRAYAVKIVDETRIDPEISCGASPRALLSMLRFSQGLAYISDRDYCIPEDIAAAAELTLPHRLVLTSEAKLNRRTKHDMIKKILINVRAS